MLLAAFLQPTPESCRGCSTCGSPRSSLSNTGRRRPRCGAVESGVRTSEDARTCATCWRAYRSVSSMCHPREEELARAEAQVREGREVQWRRSWPVGCETPSRGAGTPTNSPEPSTPRQEMELDPFEQHQVESSSGRVTVRAPCNLGGRVMWIQESEQESIPNFEQQSKNDTA